MTGFDDAGNVLWMAKRGGKPIPRESKTPLEYKLALAQRIRSQRLKLELSLNFMADQLSRALGREISADTYRQWETIKSTVQIDAVLPLCDILRIHVYELLAKAPPAFDETRVSKGKAVA